MSEQLMDTIKDSTIKSAGRVAVGGIGGGTFILIMFWILSSRLSSDFIQFKKDLSVQVVDFKNDLTSKHNQGIAEMQKVNSEVSLIRRSVGAVEQDMAVFKERLSRMASLEQKISEMERREAANLQRLYALEIKIKTIENRSSP